VGGDITSNAGALLLGQVDRGLGLTHRFAAQLLVGKARVGAQNMLIATDTTTGAFRSANLASEHLERRLAAILAADVAGYSRLPMLAVAAQSCSRPAAP
jgi:hypothetical protein